MPTKENEEALPLFGDTGNYEMGSLAARRGTRFDVGEFWTTREEVSCNGHDDSGEGEEVLGRRVTAASKKRIIRPTRLLIGGERRPKNGTGSNFK